VLPQSKIPAKFFAIRVIFVFLHTLNGLSDGVMVALQILVLPVQVRILVGQQITPVSIIPGVFYFIANAIELEF
jgi:hypothetical protein